MPQVRWPVLVPFGALTVTTPGTTIPLSTNCGPLAGQVGNPTSYTNPPVPGTPLRQITLTNSNATPGNAVALLPRGSTFTGNPGNVIAYIPGGATITIPQGQPFENGILPENFVLDIAAGTGPIVVYGCGVIS